MIFVDSNAWVGLVLKADQYHELAVKAFENLTSSFTPLITTDFVISETYTFLRYHTANFKTLLQFENILSEAEASKLLILKWTHPEIFQEARKIFFKYPDQNFSFVDCISFAAARALKIKDIFTFDNDFRTMGFHLIPLA